MGTDLGIGTLSARPNQPRRCTDALPSQICRTHISEWALREDRAFGRLIPEEISVTEHETNDCQREGAYGDFVPMKVATGYRSGKSDGELLIAVRAGDRRALEELYLGYQGRLARFLSRFTRRGVIVEEIIND